MTALSSPFDLLAPDYDASFSHTDLGRRLRTIVWRRLDAAFAPGSRVLELGCGTGEDALHLAARGVRVVPTDASAAMAAEVSRKAGAAGAGSLVTAEVLSFEQIAGQVGRLGSFDGAFSNFGAVNCASDLPGLAVTLGGLLRPGARLLLVVMGPLSPWEWVWYLRRGDLRRAFRRLSRGGVAWRGLTVRYPTPRALARAFSPTFRRRSLAPIGLFLPPTYAASSLSPAALDRLDRWERRARGIAPLSWLSDHYVIELERV